MNENDSVNCGCCAGIESVTPESVANRAGQPALRYRVGTHATFLKSMQARLSSLCLDGEEEWRQGQGRFPLQALSTRSPDDPAVAMLDAFAVVGDVLTFYQERIANEGYLRTALERRSVLELARLVGYRLRPGVAASVFLAYEMETGEPSLIPRGARVQSTPGPGETPQTFEASADLSARYEWNNLKPRQTKPLAITLADSLTVNELYFATTTANLKPNDALLLIFDDQPAHQVLRRVLETKANFTQAITVVTLQPVPPLVILLVDLLQIAVDALTIDLPGLKQSELSGFANRLEGIIRILNRVLENLRLGNFPQLKFEIATYQVNLLLTIISMVSDVNFSFEEAIAEARVSINTEDRFFAFLVRAIIEHLKTLSKDAIPLALVDPGQRFRKHLANVLIPVLDRARNLLNTPTVKDYLSCSISTLIEQDAPADDVERLVILNSLGDTRQQGFYNFVRSLRSILKELKTDDSVSKFASLALGLMDNLAGLPWQPSAAAKAKETLSGLVLLLDSQEDAHDFTIQGIGHQCKKDNASENLKSLQHSLKGVLEVKDLRCNPPIDKTVRLAELIKPLSLSPALHPSSPAFLARTPAQAFRANADAAPRMLLSFVPELRESLYAAWAAASLPAALPPLQAVHALRLTAAPFGYNAPQKIKMVSDDHGGPPFITVPDVDFKLKENPQTVFTDSEYGAILPGSYLVVRKADRDLMAVKISTTTARPRTEYSMSAKTTRLTLKRALWDNDNDGMDTLRSTTLYGQSEALPLALIPDPSPVAGAKIDLDGLYNDLDSGRWLIVSGERTDIPGVTGIQDAELVMLLGVTHSGGSAGDASPGGQTRARTTLTLSTPLSYDYKRSSVVIYGNVVKATQGETRSEVLGSGAGSQAFQKFVLRQPPLTYLATSTPSGTASTLEVRVNDLLWQEAGSPVGLEPNQRSYLTRTDDQGSTTVIFGDGHRGARPPTGVENITALYRNGIGKGGNVRKSQISNMLTRPLHARNVINPLPASGGADPDSRDQARQNVPKSLTALDRLVSVRDYADFASTFAGISKASAADLSDGHHRLVQVTVAGIEDIPISPDSDLFHSLYASLLAYGDPHQPVKLAVRELLLLVLSAEISLHPNYSWEKVRRILRDALLKEFGFEKRKLGQAVYLSTIYAVMQAVPGVAYVDVQALDALDRQIILENLPDPDPEQPQKDDLASRLGLKPRDQILVEMDRYNRKIPALLPAQIAYLTSDVPETMILNLREG